jgi:Ca2+-transporting ATPase
MFRNWLFITVIISLVGIQVIIVFEGGQAFPAAPITGLQWAISIIVGVLGLAVGAITRCIPDEAVRRIIKAVRPRCWTRQTPPQDADR